MTAVHFRRPNGEMAEFRQSFNHIELDALKRFLDQAVDVVPLRDVSRGDDRKGIVAMRHDVDHNLEHSVRFAEWEAERGYRATYYILHTAWYYEHREALQQGCERLVELGHEVGFHSNVTVLAAEQFPPRRRWSHPAKRLSREVEDTMSDILSQELHYLRDMDIEIVGIAAHGDIRCYEMGVCNEIHRDTILKFADFGLEYDADELARGGASLGDNHGTLHGTLNKPAKDKQTFALLHCEHWELS